MNRHLRLLTTSVNNARIVVDESYCLQELDKRYNLNSCINKGKKLFKQTHRTNTHIVGFAIFRDDRAKLELLHTYVIEEHYNLERDIGG